MANSGKEALTILKTIAPTFILVDLDMPTMNGQELLHVIRSQSQFDQVAVICMTADLVVHRQTAMLNEGFDGFLKKPFSIRDLAENIEQCMVHFQQYKQSKV
jgi:two-component system cell cycle response regulator DivK